jgi:hypothetical protein
MIPAARRITLCVAACLLLAIASSARATDGVVEINQAKAQAGGVTGGDAPGFPVVINAPGSYRLTSALQVGALGAADTDVIQITADDVALDLNGFTISCRRNTIPSSPCAGGAGIGRGIVATGINVRIENGTIRDMASDGVLMGANGVYVLDAVLFRDNGGNGFRAGITSDGRIQRSGFVSNLGAGLSFASNSVALLLQSTTHDNAGSGILAEAGASIFGSESRLRDEPNLVTGLGPLGGCIVLGSVRQCP